MSDKKILIAGKEIDYGDLSDEKLLMLYEKLIERQMLLLKKAEQYIGKSQINEININDVNV